MKKKYRFVYNGYAPELNKMEICLNGNFIEVPIDSSVTKKFTRSYNHNMRLVREYNNKKHDGTKSLKKFASVDLTISNQKETKTARSFKGCYSNPIEILKLVNEYKKINEGNQKYIQGFDSNKNAIYETLHNKVTYTVNIKIK